MKTLHQTVSYQSWAESELSEADARLVQAARESCASSYSPYSHFQVGAAVLLQNGVMVCGSNQENAAFPATICAERCAMFYANARYPQVAPTTIAIAARTPAGDFTEHPVSPCGVCRQVLVESQQRYGLPLRVLLCGRSEIYAFDSCSDLLPFQFDSF